MAPQMLWGPAASPAWALVWNPRARARSYSLPERRGRELVFGPADPDADDAELLRLLQLFEDVELGLGVRSSGPDRR